MRARSRRGVNCFTGRATPRSGWPPGMRVVVSPPTMFHRTDDLRIEGLRPLLPPAILMEELPLDERASTLVWESRAEIARIIHGEDDRLLLVVGPCSVHDTAAAIDYARRL